MTPKQAILAQCRFCMNKTFFRGCDSMICKLNYSSLSNLRKIKLHCISCVPDQNIKAVRFCDGKLLNGHTCSLHVFREGKNPKRKGIGGKNLPQKPPAHGAFSASIFAQNETVHIRGNRAMTINRKNRAKSGGELWGKFLMRANYAN